MTRGINWTADFKCIHCHAYVTTNSIVSGVRNRNHCPYCLWSKHLDLYRPGDRLSACRSGMQPVGLTLKRSWKKYDPGWEGEVMVIHHCIECGRFSINRIAADDDPDRILEIFESSLDWEGNQLVPIGADDVNILGYEDREVIYARLFGLTFSLTG